MLLKFKCTQHKKITKSKKFVNKAFYIRNNGSFGSVKLLKHTYKKRGLATIIYLYNLSHMYFIYLNIQKI